MLITRDFTVAQRKHSALMNSGSHISLGMWTIIKAHLPTFSLILSLSLSFFKHGPSKRHNEQPSGSHSSTEQSSKILINSTKSNLTAIAQTGF